MVDYIPLYNRMVEDLRRVKAPKILYKYMSLDAAIATVENLTLLYTPPNEFDDIFELSEIGTVSCDEKKETNPISAFMRDIGKSEELTSLSNAIGVSCFSDKSTINTMWSLYADHHRGVVIGYNSEYLFPLKRVEYISSTEEADEFPSYEQNAQYMVFTKTNDWAWQREYRSIERLDNLKNMKNGRYFKILPQEAIAEIYIGAYLNEVYTPPNKKINDFERIVLKFFKNVRVFLCMKNLSERGKIDIMPI